MNEYFNNYMQNNYPNMMNIEPMRYPDIYYMVYPFVVKKCDVMERMYNPMMYPYPSYEMIEKMTDEIYDECKACYPDALKEYEKELESNKEKSEVSQRRYRRRSLLRSLIGILLIRELAKRRYPYYYPPRRYYY